ncbi:MAG TPA: hypothetical protein VF756_17775 [Thermoanaerobaculia bacterium]
MSNPVRREYLGADPSLAERSRVYRTPEALEIDLVSYTEITRKRVFFDEIVLVTLHRARTIGATTWIFGALGAFTLLMAMAVLAGQERQVGNAMLATALALGAIALLASMVPTWTVTVFGRRTRARVRFTLREGKARRIYGEICRAASEAQREVARRIAAEQPAPPPLPLSPDEEPPPMPPSEPSGPLTP